MAFTLNLAVEELFTNMVKYNRRATSDITLSIESTKSAIVVTLVDHDADIFDVTKTNDIDVNQQLEHRKVGGLGLYLVKKLVDELHYQYNDGESVITFKKYLENDNV